MSQTQLPTTHEPIKHGLCPICKHYGDDCTGGETLEHWLQGCPKCHSQNILVNYIETAIAWAKLTIADGKLLAPDGITNRETQQVDEAFLECDDCYHRLSIDKEDDQIQFG